MVKLSKTINYAVHMALMFSGQKSSQVISNIKQVIGIQSTLARDLLLQTMFYLREQGRSPVQTSG